MLKKNILFNYLGQLYLSAIGICIFPLYLKYIGGEAYGLVGFFVMLQTWMLLFDLGMSPTLSRQVAISNAQGDSKDLKRLLRSLETIFFVIAAVISILMYAFSDMIAKKWLIIKELNINEVAVCIALMGGVVSFRWFTTLYKSGINGYERQVWINVANIIVITLRLPVALFIFIFIHNPLVIYFLYQLIISLCELIIFQRKMYNCLPETSRNIKIPLISGNILKKVFPFAVGTAYTAGIWVLLTQLDKLLLSKVLTLSDFGFFSLVATLVGGILMLSTPVSNAILPRLTALLSQGKLEQLVNIYNLSTKFVCCIIFPITTIMICFPYQVIYGWTGNAMTSKWAEDILPLYALGNALLAVIGFQYYLQYAYGKLRLHVLYNTVLAIISIPAVYYCATRYGAIGTGYVWVCLNIITLFFWTYIVHNKFLPGIHFKWLTREVIFPALLTFLYIMMISILMHNKDINTRFEDLLFVVAITGSSIFINISICFYSQILKFVKR